MKALVTGASSGIGREIALDLSNRGYDLILVARRKERLIELKNKIKTNVEIISLDLTKKENCLKLYEKCSDIDVLINNAGFGLHGYFTETDLDRELEMIDLNVVSVHILTKLFLKDFKKRNKGYILNVASSASFLPGPLMATYYSTKAYVLRLTESINKELKKQKIDVQVSALCPGPVNTEFNEVANVKFGVKALESNEVAHYAIKKLFNRKMIIIPGFKMKVGIFFTRFLPTSLLSNISYNIQKKKVK